MTKGVQDLMFAVERVRDAFYSALYTARDVDATIALVGDECVLQNRPIGTGARSATALRRYLADDVVSHLPADLRFERVSRTGNRWNVAQEELVSFTHECELPWLLPGVAPTGRQVQVMTVSVTTVQRSLITEHRTLWDHASLLAQLGLIPAELTTVRL